MMLLGMPNTFKTGEFQATHMPLVVGLHGHRAIGRPGERKPPVRTFSEGIGVARARDRIILVMIEEGEIIGAAKSVLMDARTARLIAERLLAEAVAAEAQEDA